MTPHPMGKTRMSVVQTKHRRPPPPNLQCMFWDQRQQSSHACGCRHSPEQSAALVHQKSMALRTAAPPPPPPEGKGSEDTVYGSVGQRTAGRERCCQHEWILRCNPQSPPGSSSGRTAASSAAEKRSGSSLTVLYMCKWSLTSCSSSKVCVWLRQPAYWLAIPFSPDSNFS